MSFTMKFDLPLLFLAFNLLNSFANQDYSCLQPHKDKTHYIWTLVLGNSQLNF